MTVNVQKRGEEKHGKSSAECEWWEGELMERCALLALPVGCLLLSWVGLHTPDITSASVGMQGHIHPGSQSCFCLSVPIRPQHESAQGECGLCPNTQNEALATFQTCLQVLWDPSQHVLHEPSQHVLQCKDSDLLAIT